MGDYGIKVTKPGYDIASATDKQLVLKSELALQKVAASGATTVARNTIGSYTHGLGYIPQYLIFCEDPQNPSNMLIGSRSVTYSPAEVWADSTKVYWYVTASSGGPFDIYYYVFYDQV